MKTTFCETVTDGRAWLTCNIIVEVPPTSEIAFEGKPVVYNATVPKAERNEEIKTALRLSLDDIATQIKEENLLYPEDKYNVDTIISLATEYIDSLNDFALEHESNNP